MSTVRLFGFSGSLRKGSLNTQLLHALGGLLPADVSLQTFDIGTLPLFNSDLDSDETRPEAVTQFKQGITSADGVVIVSPEYNYGVPGVVKNALDWASRPGFNSPMSYKPVALMGASPGGSGTMRMQEQLKQVLAAMLAQPFPHPGVAVKDARNAITDEGLSEGTAKFVRGYLEGYVDWVRDANSIRG